MKKYKKEEKIFTIKIEKIDFDILKRFVIENGAKIKKDEDVIREIFFVQTMSDGQVEENEKYFSDLDLRDDVKVVSAF